MSISVLPPPSGATRPQCLVHVVSMVAIINLIEQKIFIFTGKFALDCKKIVRHVVSKLKKMFTQQSYRSKKLNRQQMRQSKPTGRLRRHADSKTNCLKIQTDNRIRYTA